MLITAIVLFIISAILGLFVLIALLRNKTTPKPAVFIHGPIALLALILLITYAVIKGTSPLLMTSIALFILAALGGLALFTIDMRKKPIPKLLAILHPVIAVAGFIVLMVDMLQ